MSARLVRRFRALPPNGRDPARRLRIEPAGLRDYDALAPLHYRAGRPATCALVLRAVDPRDPGDPVGVLVVSYPTLNGPWRDLAWPGRFRTGDRRADAARLNRDLRTISRVVVDPRWRALGVGRRLVRAYLRCALTPATEAIAAMGLACPLFRAAGMTEHRAPPPARDRRLAELLRALRVEPCDLLDPLRARALLQAHATLRPALRRWAAAAGHTRALPGPLARARAAAVALTAPRVAYTAAPRAWRRTTRRVP